MSARDHEEYRENIGPYVLGALPELEAAILERHLASCEGCRAEVEELRPVTGAIARSVPQVEPPESLKQKLMATVRAEAEARAAAAQPERRQRKRPAWLAGLRPRVAAAAALAVLALGVVIGVTADRASHHGERTVSARINRTLVPTGNASLAVSSDRSNASVRLSDVPKPGSGHLYELWVQHGDGTISPGPTVANGGDREVKIPGGVRGARAVMMTVESHRVAKPTGPVIMTFNV
jgi:anti-sigma-K factor RskA